ncbi:ABC-2 transporter permease [Bacillus sonorensis]|nr:ABC-2 transporter permease [Bacillus sonorensis]
MSILLMVFFTFTLANIGQVGFLVSVLAVTYQLALGASSLEDKNNSDKILISLPIRKSTIVLSKYASIYVYAAFAILIYYVVYLVIKLVNAPLDISFNLTGILGAAVTVTLFCSISFPLIFKYGYLKSRMANMVIFFVFIFGGSGLFKFLNQGSASWNQSIIAFLQNATETGAIALLICVLLLILILSYTVSLHFYQKREF